MFLTEQKCYTGNIQITKTNWIYNFFLLPLKEH